MTVADNNDTWDWAADCNGERRERAVRYGRDSRVVMMAAVAEDGGGGQKRWRWTTTAADDNGMRDLAADYKDGQERAARDGGDTEWQWRLRQRIMAAVDVGGDGGRWQRRTTKAVDDKGGGWWRHVRSSGGLRGGKKENERRTTTALDKRLISLPGREHEK